MGFTTRGYEEADEDPETYRVVTRGLDEEPVSRKDFHVLRLLGCGGFGEVRLVRCSRDQGLYAMKAVSKADLVEKRYTDSKVIHKNASDARSLCNTLNSRITLNMICENTTTASII